MPIDYGPQDYVPRALIRLIVRFDEFGATTKLKPAPKKIVKNLNGVKDNRDDLVVVKDPDQPSRFLIQQKGVTAASPAQESVRSADGLTYDFLVMPLDADWNQNGIRSADTLSAMIRYIDCPFDPRVIRACAVELLLGTVPIEQAGVSWTTPSDALPRTYTDENGKTRTNLRFQGWVDKWTIEWNEAQEPVIRLECRDNTQLLIDQPAPPKLVLDGKKPIDEAIANYLAHFPQMAGLVVEYRPGSDERPVLEKVMQKSAFRPKLGPQPGKGGGDKLSVWDYLTDVCRAIGHSIRVDGILVVVQRVRSMTSSEAPARGDDPFTGRTLSTGEKLQSRRFIYGRNLRDMRITRNYSKTTPTNVEVRSYNTEQKKLLVARFPLKEDRQTYALPGDAQPDQKWVVFNISGVKDEKIMRATAQTIYESLGRNELQIEFKTDNLASFGGGNLDPDILDMKVPDSFELLVNRSDDDANTLNTIEKALTSQAKNAAFLKVLGFDDDIASAYAKAYTDAGFLTTFRSKQIKIGWHLEPPSIEVHMVGVNFIEVRADKQLPAGEEPTTAGANLQTAPKHTVEP